VILTTLSMMMAAVNTATVPAPINNDWWMGRHRAMVQRAQQGNVDLVLIGDSITHAFGGQPDTGDGFHNRGKDTWDLFFGDSRTLNLGISGDRTQHVLWRLDNGELDGINPKVVEIMIGTNNVGSNTPAEIAEGVVAVANRVHAKLPKAKILLMGVFPRATVGSAQRKAVDEVNVILAKTKLPQVTYLNIGPVFLDQKGEIPDSVMPDKLHPMAYGYRLWAMAMEPTLSKLIGRRPITQNNPMNSAVVPVTHNRDFALYDWDTRHQFVLTSLRALNPKVVFIGDSITHRWGGAPLGPGDNTPPTGRTIWDVYLKPWGAANLGFGWDRTENVLWRIEQGEIDGIHPEAIVVLIGTNNIGFNSPAEIGDGVRAIAESIRSRHPKAKILLLNVLPRGEKADSPDRTAVANVNRELARISGVEHLDLGAELLQPDGSISASTMGDFLHPTQDGYRVMARRIDEALKKMLR